MQRSVAQQYTQSNTNMSWGGLNKASKTHKPVKGILLTSLPTNATTFFDLQSTRATQKKLKSANFTSLRFAACTAGYIAQHLLLTSKKQANVFL